MSLLFSPLAIGGIEIENRVTVSPMCQYSAHDGCMTDWHMQHLMSLALSGAGLVTIEATGVCADGRITPGCVGLWSDAQEGAMRRVVDACRGISTARISLQIGHAGRKASAQRPWAGGRALSAEEGAWQTFAPSAVPLSAGWHTPMSLDAAGMSRIRDAFVAAAKRALRLGIDAIEVHSAHGYLLNEFLSPLTNQRTDRYGGSIENRMRFPLEVFEAVRAVWPKDRALGARIPGSDYVDGAWGPQDGVAYARALEAAGCEFVTVSGGGVVLDARVPVGPGYQVPFAQAVKEATGMVTGAVGLISDARQAEAILQEGKADYVAIARAFLFNPRWALHAALELGDDARFAPQYARAHPDLYPPAKAWVSG